MSETRRTCGTCKWMHSPQVGEMTERNSEDLPLAKGTCHFNPPTLHGFPSVMAHSDFCRQHQSRQDVVSMLNRIKAGEV